MKKRLTALLLALALLSSLIVGVLADEETKSEDETPAQAETTTPDAAGTLSFENLSARMKSGYYTIRALEENIAAIECVDYDKMYEDLRKGLNELASAEWTMIQYGMLDNYTKDMMDQQYDALHDTFEDIKEGKLQENNADLVRQLRNAENQILMAGQTLYVTLLGLETQSAALDRQSASLSRTVTEMKLRYELGQISAMTLQQTEAGQTQLESGRQTLQMNIDQLKRQLSAMVGEEPTVSLTLQKLPAVTAEQLAAMDLEKDLEKAKQASYELYTAKQTLDDADEDYKDKGSEYSYDEKKYEFVSAKHQWQAAQFTYNATVQNFELNFRTLYAQVKDYQQALESAKTSLECKRADYQTAQLKHDQGSISDNALLESEDKLSEAQDTVTNAEYDLFTAYNNYCWAVNEGLLNG